MLNQEEKISASIVEDKNRMDFIPNLVNNHFPSLMNFENIVYSLADKFIDDYKGGYWEFWSLSNGSGFISLSEEESFQAVNGFNYSSEEFNGKELGIVLTVFSFNYLIDKCKNKAARNTLIKHYHGLMNYIAELEKNDHIMRFLD